MTRTEGTRGATVTEIEIYDTTQPPGSLTGKHPVKARIRQRKAESGESLTVESTTESAQTGVKAEAASSTESDTRSKEAVTAAPAAWEKFKNIFSTGAAIILLLASAGAVYKLFKFKRQRHANR